MRAHRALFRKYRAVFLVNRMLSSAQLSARQMPGVAPMAVRPVLIVLGQPSDDAVSQARAATLPG